MYGTVYQILSVLLVLLFLRDVFRTVDFNEFFYV